MCVVFIRDTWFYLNNGLILFVYQESDEMLMRVKTEKGMMKRTREEMQSVFQVVHVVVVSVIITIIVIFSKCNIKYIC